MTISSSFKGMSPLLPRANCAERHPAFRRSGRPATRAQRLAIAWILLSAMSGCLPIPNTRVEGSGIKSRIVEFESNLPVVNATVWDVYGTATKSDRNGEFFLKPHVQWHFGYLCGPISYPIWPYTFDLVTPGRRFRVRAAGYVERQFDVEWERRRQDIQLADPQGHVLLIAPIRLQKETRAKAN